MTAEEPTSKPISPSPSNIPETAFPFSQRRRSRHGRTNPAPARGQQRQQRQHTPLSFPFLSSFPPQGRGSLAASQGLAKRLPFPWVWSTARLGRGQALVCRQVRVPWAQHPSSCHPRVTVLAGCPQPSCLPPSPHLCLPTAAFPPCHRHGDPSPTCCPPHTTPLSSCNLPWKTNYHPQTHIFSKQSSHFLFASPSPSLSWVSLLFVLAILVWRLFGEGNTV